MSVWSACAVTLVGLLFSYQVTVAVDVKPQAENYVPDYRIYHNLSDVAFHLRKIASRHHDFVRIDWTYKSRNGMPQLLTRITNFSTGTPDVSNFPSEVPKAHVLFSYGEHAREFFPVESFFNLLKNLTGGLSSAPGSYAEKFSRRVLSAFDIYAIVMANPDGRRHLETSGNYCWRGTSTGVDLNRNFDWQFAKKGSSADPKDEEFRGPYPFSEPECRVYMELTQAIQFDAFLSFHSGIRHIYVPYSDTASKVLKRVPPNFHHISQLSSRLAAATQYGFRYGTVYDLSFYTADGTAFDYMAGVSLIPFSLAIEMWEHKHHRGLSCFDEFNPKSQHLMMEVEAFHPMYVELFSYLQHWKFKEYESLSTLPVMVMDHPSMTLNYVLLALVVVLFIVLAYRKRQHICATKRRIVHLRRLSSTFTLGGKMF